MVEVLKSIKKVMGFRVAGIHAGLKANDALDLALIVSGQPCVAAGVYTQNKFQGAPVVVTKDHIAQRGANVRALVINTKIANAGTGLRGEADARQMAQLVAEHIGCAPEQVLVMSTGVIGEHLPMGKIEAGIKVAHSCLAPQQWEQAATAIMTTDTQPKYASVEVMTPNGAYTLAGIAKGSGMIAPNMATLLGAIFTDVQLTSEQAQQALTTATHTSFNRITIDSDTSPNDMVTLMANGASGVVLASDADWHQFQTALTQLCAHLAQAIVRDGEGATKFITLNISGAASDADAEQIAHTIANSPLVKTAFFGNDANWGRIIAAAGRAGVPFDPNQTSLSMVGGTEPPANGDGVLLFENGTRTDFHEDHIRTVVEQDTIYVTLKVGDGPGQATVWTCDLSHDYVSINADYRT